MNPHHVRGEQAGGHGLQTALFSVAPTACVCVGAQSVAVVDIGLGAHGGTGAARGVYVCVSGAGAALC